MDTSRIELDNLRVDFNIAESELNEAEKWELLTLKKLSYLKSIRNSMCFFVIISVISIIMMFLSM